MKTHSTAQDAAAHDLSYALAQACLGRENHAALVEVRALSHGGERVTFVWRDCFTQETGYLGSLRIRSRSEAGRVVAALFSQLRAWRARCEQQQPAGAKTVAAGGGAR